MKYSDFSTTSRRSPAWIKFASASLIALAVAGCGGGGTGANTTTTPVSAGTNATPATTAAAAAWKALAPQITVTKVDIPATGAGNPVVNFSVKDAAGNPIVGLANYSQGSTATVKALTNFGFTLAKLVPGTNNEPSKWVSYNVIKRPTVAQAGTATTASAVAAAASCNQVAGTGTLAAPQTAPTWCGTWPSTDAQGALVDNGDGTYKYTFDRDVKQVATIVAGLNNTADGLSLKADLGDVSYAPTLTHRLGIQLGGAAPGTGSNTPNAVTNAAYPTVNMVNTANAVYDFRPDGGAIANTRTVVSIENCGTCHQSKVLAHGSRKDPNYCVTCHTDQVKFSINAEATPVGAFTLTGTTNFNTSVVNGQSLANFPNMIHKIHMGKLLVKQGYNFIPGTSGNGVKFNALAIPQDVRNCATCHTAGAKTPNGEDWKAVPSALACGSCHDGIDFATGVGSTLADKAYDLGKVDKTGAVKAVSPVGTTKTNHGTLTGLAQPTNSGCITCHTAAANAIYHGDVKADTGITGLLPRKPMSTAAARPMSAVISGVTIDATPASVTGDPATTVFTGTGKVTVKFTISDGTATPVTSPTAISGLQFTFAKLNPAVNGASTEWQSYTGKTRGSSTGLLPVQQGYSEAVKVVDATNNYPVVVASAANPGDLSVDAVTGVWTYIFRLDNASTLLGNITKLDKLYLNGSGNVLTGAVTTDVTKIFDKLVTYDWWKTHRVGMEFNSGPKATAVPNKFNAIKDWVPLADTTRKAETRNIVSMNTCASCHNGIKIHKGYTTEYCVTCHNANTYDPTSGVSGSLIGTKPVDLQVIVHKLHMGKLLPSVIAGGTYKISSADYSAVNYPGVISNCAACHTATATKANGTTLLENAANWYTVPTKAACAGCHDGAATLAHIDAQTTTSGVQTCITCHGPNSTIGVDVKTVHGQK